MTFAPDGRLFVALPQQAVLAHILSGLRPE